MAFVCDSGLPRFARNDNNKFATLVIIALLLTLALGGPAFAMAVDAVTLPEPAQEARARLIMNGLRCLVCQNQSIEMSDAPLAADLRQIVRARVAAGDSDDQVRAYMTARYGDWVLMRPPFQASTLLLWLGPGVLLLAGGAGLWARLRRRQSIEPAALSGAERTRLQALTEPE